MPGNAMVATEAPLLPQPTSAALLLRLVAALCRPYQVRSAHSKTAF